MAVPSFVMRGVWALCGHDNGILANKANTLWENGSSFSGFEDLLEGIKEKRVLQLRKRSVGSQANEMLPHL